MRNGTRRQRRTADDEEDFDRSALHFRVLRFVLRRPRDSFAILLAAAAVTAITVNGLFLQRGPHPAPIFAIKPLPVNDSPATVSALPRPRPPEAGRSRVDIMTDIQRELVKRGFYDGPVDGVYGAKTDAAIRDFEQAAGLKASTDINEALLASIVRSNARPKVAHPVLAPHKDAIAELIAPPRSVQPVPVPQPVPAPQPVPMLVPVPQAAPRPAPQAAPQAAAPPAAPRGSPQVLAVQRALSEFGYGQIKATGVFDADTRLAIQRFERDRRLPITGEMSERVRRELSALTGRPLD